MFDASNVLVSANVEAERWLDDIYGMEPDGRETWRELLPDGSSRDLRSAIPVLPLLARARPSLLATTTDQPVCGSVTARAVGSSSTPPA